MTEEQHSALAARTLSLEEPRWRQFRAAFAHRCPLGTESFAQRVRVLTELWQTFSPHASPLEKISPESDCPVCDATVQPIAARRRHNQAPLIYGACRGCGLGVLLQGGTAGTIYQQASYYQHRDAGNAGYERYLAERAYREAKGRRLLQWMVNHAQRKLTTLLEIGSGFGFTRAAAEQLGMVTAGVDVNPFAARMAAAIYGQTTFTGTLADASAATAIEPLHWDAVLYLFVLEHLPTPQEELFRAAQMLAPGGVLALVVPNMQALEREIFGASYRSFRHDHLWLFSVPSLQLLLERAGLTLIAAASECNIRLLSGFLTEQELNQLELDCRAADLLVLAERKSS